MPGAETASQDQISFQQLSSGLPDDCSHVLRAVPEINTTAKAVDRAQLLVTILNHSSTATVASVKVSRDLKTAAIENFQDNVKRLIEQMFL